MRVDSPRPAGYPGARTNLESSESPMDEKLEKVLDFFRRMVKTDGGVLELVSVEGGRARIRYTPGHNEECPECVHSAQDLLDMLRGSLEIHAPHIRDVEVV